MKATTALYVSNCFQMLHAKGWSFLVPLLFASLGGDDSMKLLTVYGTVVSVFQLVAVPVVGILVDLLSLRSSAVLSFLSHVSIIMNCAVFLSMVDGPAIPIAAKLLFAAGGAASEIFGDFNSIIMEMKVAPALVPKDDDHRVVLVTANVKRTKFLARMLIPVLVGWYASLTDSVRMLALGMLLLHVITAAVNAACWFVILASVHDDEDAPVSRSPTGKSKKKSATLQGLKGMLPVLGCCFAYGIMYCTVLSATSSVFTATLKRRGVPATLLGGSRSAGALGGLLGTILWPSLCSKVGVGTGAVLSVVLYAAFTVLTMPSLAISPVLALGSLTAARPFFCMFELGIINTLQHKVPKNMRGRAVVFYELFYVLSMVGMDVLAMVFYKADQFWILCSVSAVATSIGAVCFMLCVGLLPATKSSKDDGSSVPVQEYQTLQGSGVEKSRRASFKAAARKIMLSAKFASAVQAPARVSPLGSRREDVDLIPAVCAEEDEEEHPGGLSPVFEGGTP
eukprot:TRINITY_DN61757_c0_g1_i1.p1 TRINITY_DN61757_c0_g1~~TRINITY_DN61757_c0_g1_i1.p1  ORF type:complete len:509 (+),score=91.38 TRINITY_DN61757_c0_g1_i1:90-1616(+)